MEKLYFTLSTDCEATQPAVDDPGLGERSTRGLAEVLEGQGWGGTFFVIPTDIEAHPAMYRQLDEGGHEVGLHVHPAAQGYEEFLGVYDAQMQHDIIKEAADRFAQVMGYLPETICPGYYSANDDTFGVLVKLGFRHGVCSCPGRILPECASVWAGAPWFMHYAHPNYRVLAGDLDFVDIPRTADGDSMMWGGKHPQDLRVELVDAKNQFYTIKKSVKKQMDENVPVKHIHAVTHNYFEYLDPGDFRRQTLEGIISHYKQIADSEGLETAGVPLSDLATLYRQKVETTKLTLSLDRRGHVKKE